MLNKKEKSGKEKLEKKHIIGGILGVILICLVVYFFHENSYVHFKDINMGISICSSMEFGYSVTVEDVRYRELDQVKRLCIGNPQNYTTLEDIKKCKKIEEICILGYAGADTEDYAYRLNEEEQEMSAAQVEEFQEELSQVLPKLKNLKSFRLINVDGKCNINSIDFLKECKNLEEVAVCYSDIKDYSVLAELPQLKTIDLGDCSIETADDLLELKNPEKILINNTPLAENEKEMQRLKDAFPEADIIGNRE